MKLVLLGPPGAGKGTQAIMLADHFQIPHISTGDMFREAISQKTTLGLKAKVFIDGGNLVPDQVTVNIVRERLARQDCEKGFILDGFPRTLHQAHELAGILETMKIQLDWVIDIQLPPEEILRRLENRRSCPNCNAVYHLIFNPPLQENRCDRCSSRLVQRRDDMREVIENRIVVYKKLTEPLEEYYESLGILKRFDGGKPIKELLADIISDIKERNQVN